MFPVNLGSPQLWASSILDLCWLTSGAMAGALWKRVRSGVPPSYLHWVDWCELYNLCKTERFPLSLCYSGPWDLAFCGFIHWRCCGKFQTLKQQRQQATLSFQSHDVLGSPALSSWEADRPLPSTACGVNHPSHQIATYFVAVKCHVTMPRPSPYVVAPSRGWVASHYGNKTDVAQQLVLRDRPHSRGFYCRCCRAILCKRTVFNFLLYIIFN